jgi:hypothetical protein
VQRATNILKTVNKIKKDSQVIRPERYESKRDRLPLKRDVIFNEKGIEQVIKDCDKTITYHGKRYRTDRKMPF